MVNTYALDHGYGCAVCTADVYYDAVLTVSGSCFEPGDDVVITVCDDQYVLWLYDYDTKEYVTEIEANECGAFFGRFYVDANYGYWYDVFNRPISVRAWTDADLDEVVGYDYLYQVEDGELMANWPLYLMWD